MDRCKDFIKIEHCYCRNIPFPLWVKNKNGSQDLLNLKEPFYEKYLMRCYTRVNSTFRGAW